MGLMKRLYERETGCAENEHQRKHDMDELRLAEKFVAVQLWIRSITKENQVNQLNQINKNAMIKANQNDGASLIAPSGTHVARCYQIVHIGTISDTFQGEQKLVNKVRLNFELPDCLHEFSRDKGEQPFSIGRDFTVSMHEKSALRQFLQTWLGKPLTDEEAFNFDIGTMIGKPCMVTVMHRQSANGKTYANIQGISSLMKGLVCPEAINPEFVLDFDALDFDTKVAQLPEWLQAKILSSLEYVERNSRR